MPSLPLVLSNLWAGLSWHTIGDFAVRNSRVITIAAPIVLSNLVTLALYSKESVELAPAIITLCTLRETAMQRDSALVEYEVDVLSCFSCYAVSVVRLLLAGPIYLRRRGFRSYARSLLEREH